MDEYYQILELQPGASIEEIEAAYKKLLQIWHPDYFQRNPELARMAEDRTKLINDAHDKIIEYLKTGRQPRAQTKKPHSESYNRSSTYETDSDRAAKAAEEKARKVREQAAKEWAAREQARKEFEERKRAAERRAAEEQAERERLARERAEAERVARERTAQERVEKERIEQIKLKQKEANSVAIRRAMKSLKYAAIIYPIVGFGGCNVRMFNSMNTTLGKHRNDTHQFINSWWGYGFGAYKEEAVHAALIVIAIGILLAVLTKVLAKVG